MFGWRERRRRGGGSSDVEVRMEGKKNREEKNKKREINSRCNASCRLYMHLIDLKQEQELECKILSFEYSQFSLKKKERK